jgi:hypothetical protein
MLIAKVTFRSRNGNAFALAVLHVGIAILNATKLRASARTAANPAGYADEVFG